MTILALHTLVAAPRRRRRRLGRGNASGRGTYAGRGLKGQRARSGGRRGLKQRALRALFQRLPKRGGFTSLRPKAAAVTLDTLRKHFRADAVITPRLLVAHGLAPRGVPVKILNTGRLDRALTISGCRLSAGARERLLAAGGKVTE